MHTRPQQHLCDGEDIFMQMKVDKVKSRKKDMTKLVFSGNIKKMIGNCGYSGRTLIHENNTNPPGQLSPIEKRMSKI